MIVSNHADEREQQDRDRWAKRQGNRDVEEVDPDELGRYELESLLSRVSWDYYDAKTMRKVIELLKEGKRKDLDD